MKKKLKRNWHFSSMEEVGDNMQVIFSCTVKNCIFDLIVDIPLKNFRKVEKNANEEFWGYLYEKEEK